MEPDVTEAAVLFKKINKELLQRFKGKIVAIDTGTGNYFIGDSELDAYKKAMQKHPNNQGKQFVFKRVGFDSTHFVGAL